MALTIPPNNRAVGTPDPANDMDSVSDVLGLLTQAIAQISGSASAYHGGDAANIAAIQAFIAGGRSFPNIGIYNVQDTGFAGGAKGNSSNDDTAACQAAINQAGAVNGAVLWPPSMTSGGAAGQYMISRTLEIPHAMGMYGFLNSETGIAGSQIQQVPGSNLNALVATTGWLENTTGTARGAVTLDGLYFSGEGQPGSSTQTSGFGHLVVLQAFGVRVRNCYFTQSFGDGLRFDAWGISTASYTYTASNDGSGNCLFTAPGFSYTNGAAVALSGGTAPGGFTNSASFPYYVVNLGIGGTGTFELSLTSGGAPIVFTSAGSGTQTVTAYELNSGDNCHVFENNFAHVGTIGFHVNSSTASVFSDGLFSHNTLASSPVAAVSIDNSSDWEISQNHCYGNTQSGLIIGRPGKTRVLYNKVDDWGNSTTAATYCAIDFGFSANPANSPNNIIQGNICLGNTPGNTSSLIHGIAMKVANSGTSGARISGNVLPMNGAGGTWAGQAIRLANQNSATTLNMNMNDNQISGPWGSPPVNIPGGTVTFRGDINNSGVMLPSVACTYTSGTVTITGTNSFVAGNTVIWTSGPPTGFSAGTVYYVISTSLTSAHFELSATSGGTAITPSSTGSGTVQQVTAIGSGGTVAVSNSAIQTTTRITLAYAPALGGATPAAALYISAQAAGSFTITGTAGAIVQWVATEP